MTTLNLVSNFRNTKNANITNFLHLGRTDSDGHDAVVLFPTKTKPQ